MAFNHIPFEKVVSSDQRYVRDIIEDEKGNIIVVTALDILIYDTLKRSLVSFLNNIEEYNVLKKEGIRTYLKDRNNRIWIGSISFGLFAYDNTGKKLISSPSYREKIDISDKIFCIIENINGDIWIGTDNGIYIINSDLSEVNVIRTQKNQKGISSNNIIEIFTDSRERIWIGTDGGGLNLYDSKTSTFSVFEHNEFNNTSISNNSIRSIYEDKQGIIWLGTYQGGVSYAQLDRKKQFILIKNEAGNTNSLIYNAVGAVYEDKKGNLWIGTDGGGLDYYNTVSGKFKHYLYDPENPNSISGKSILTISEDKKGKIWIATNGGGLNKYTPETDDFIHYQSGGENSLISNWCLKIFEDSYGYLWIGTYAGLCITDLKNNLFYNYKQSDEPGSLCDNWVYSFAEDSIKNMWVGKSNGLNYYDRKSQGFTKIIGSEILPNTTINGILTDNENNLWLSTNKGISKLNPFDLSIRTFLVLDGLQGNQFIHGSYFKNNDGKMYFGGLNGINIFYPDSIQINQFKPPVCITDLLVFYKEVPINEEGSPLTKSITETEKVTLTYKQSLITFRYTALNYISAEKNSYAYKLEGFDKDWNYVGSRREATFTNLNPGTYVFRVKASNNDGVWNEEGTSLKVVVFPPWWKTLIFKLVVVLFVLASVISFYLYRIDRFKK